MDFRMYVHFKFFNQGVGKSENSVSADELVDFVFTV